jgi:hypothetical protein
VESPPARDTAEAEADCIAECIAIDKVAEHVLCWFTLYGISGKFQGNGEVKGECGDGTAFSSRVPKEPDLVTLSINILKNDMYAARTYLVVSTDEYIIRCGDCWRRRSG